MCECIPISQSFSHFPLPLASSHLSVSQFCSEHLSSLLQNCPLYLLTSSPSSLAFFLILWPFNLLSFSLSLPSTPLPLLFPPATLCLSPSTHMHLFLLSTPPHLAPIQVFCQLIKQTAGISLEEMDTPGVLSCWQTLACMCCTYIPERAVKSYLTMHIKK